MPITPIDHENELFASLADGEEQAFEEIYWHYLKRLYPYILKMVKDETAAEEIVQETFLQLWEKRTSLRNVHNPAAYLYSMAGNRMLNYLKKEGNKTRILQNYALGRSELSNETENSFDLQESRALIEEAIGLLPAQRKIIFELSRKDGLSNEQIAEKLQISRQTVKNQLVSALKHIRSFMESRQGLFSYALYFILTNK